MFSRLSLRNRLITVGLLATALPLVVFGVLAARQGARVQTLAEAGCNELAFRDLDHVAANLLAMCEAQRANLDQQVASNVRFADNLLTERGGAAATPDQTVAWDAVN